jgi:hypothetical protein
MNGSFLAPIIRNSNLMALDDEFSKSDCFCRPSQVAFAYARAALIVPYSSMSQRIFAFVEQMLHAHHPLNLEDL